MFRVARASGRALRTATVLNGLSAVSTGFVVRVESALLRTPAPPPRRAARPARCRLTLHAVALGANAAVYCAHWCCAVLERA